ncbi:MAG: Lrp/AsnC family transcriptional regulator [Deltaproteobacteria bacterium]|nr:Lrp/AsnC family transcriptional regulator [Deltaproteobacteria bacterium]
MNLTDREKKIIRFLQKDLPLVPRPFAALEKTEGIPEDEVLSTLTHWLREGVIRKLAALIRHREAGFTRNAMVAWAVPAEHCNETGTRLAAYREVTHCYQREPAFQGKYNLFTMIHLKEGSMDTLLNDMSTAVSISDYVVLESLAELKKTSMEYF